MAAKPCTGYLKKDGVLVNVGDTVKQGQHIGYSGNTGYTAFPHLHFQVYDKDWKKHQLQDF